MVSASKVFDTATSATVAGSRDASRQARSISCRTVANPVRLPVLVVDTLTRHA
jgi:hypothetical protein